MKKIPLLCLVTAAVSGVLSGTAHAVPTLQISDGITTVTVADNSGGDSQSAPGQVIWIGSIGNWTLNVQTGTTFPAVGTLAFPQLDLGFNAVSNSSGGTLVISFSADGFGPTSGSTLASIGGTISGSGAVSYSAFGGVNNALFSTSNLLSSQGPFTTPSFSSTVTGGNVNNAGPYSLTQRVSITHTGQAQSTGDVDFHLQVPESSTSVLLLGMGLTVVGLIARARPPRHLICAAGLDVLS